MADIETLGILQDIESLVADQLQVVSYKWLSRNYLLSSDSAKSLLEEFVEKHGKGLEVVYALSGWLKSDSSSYHIRLVAGPKLNEAKLEFNGSCSVQVYSVQSCIPKDPAVLWNAEFVQAEELFKQPSTVENCLRDNRFCAITSPFVKRTVDGTSSSVPVTPQIQSGLSIGPTKCSLTRQNVSTIPQTLQPKEEQISSKSNLQSTSVVKDVKSESNGAGVQDQANKPPANKEKANAVQAYKKKAQNSKNSSGAEGSLVTFWNRASSKSKASGPAENSTATSAEAQICAQEAAAVERDSSDDDGQEMNFKRVSDRESTRKRRVVMDFSDDEDFGDAVNLSSPEKEQPLQFMEESIKSLVPKKSSSNVDKRVKEKPKTKEKGIEVVVKPMEIDSSTVGHDKLTEKSPKEKVLSSVPENHVNKKDKPTKAAPDSPKRRKVIKTRIDERGREVTEVVWEGEETEAKKADNGATNKSDSVVTKKAENNYNNTSTKDVNRAPPTKKSPSVGNTAPSNPGGKVGNKKTGNKDPKQGNILSFFKKV